MKKVIEYQLLQGGKCNEGDDESLRLQKENNLKHYVSKMTNNKLNKQSKILWQLKNNQPSEKIWKYENEEYFDSVESA